MHKSIKALANASAIFVLAACGGGGGSSSPTSPAASSGATTPIPTQTAATATLVTSVPAATYFVGSPEAGAFAQLNALRSQCGFGMVQQNSRLDVAAAAHANYVANSADTNRFGHTENPAFPEFTGVTPSDRATATGYGPAGEIQGGNAYFTEQPTDVPGKSYIKGMLTSPYHGGALLAPFSHFGIGQKLNRLTGTKDYPVKELVITANLGRGNPAVNQLGSADIATYPCDGLTGFFPAFYEGERPAPFPASAYTNGKRGASLFIVVRSDQKLAVTSSVLTDATGKILPGQMKNAANDAANLAPNFVIYSPDLALAPSTQHTWRIAGTNNGVAFERTITFTTDIVN